MKVLKQTFDLVEILSGELKDYESLLRGLIDWVEENFEKRTELVNCNLTDAYFPESYSLKYILRSFRSLDTCTYKGIGFDEAVKTYQNEERETLGKVYTKIDNAIKKAE